MAGGNLVGMWRKAEMDIRTAVEKLDARSALAAVALCLVALFYWWDMYAIAPWYDELYSYVHFILSGVKYTATHWPLPNNHVLFNLLSSVLAHFTADKVLVLRGVSYVSTVLTAFLLYFWLKRDYGRSVGLIAVVAFAGGTYALMLGVQGRGYALSMLLFTVALIACSRILKGGSVRWFAVWAIAIALAAYDVPSNLYWIALLFLATVIQVRDLHVAVRLCLFSIGGALFTFILYMPIWLTTASEAGYAGGFIGALWYGIKAMLSNRFIQGVGADGFASGLFAWLGSLGNSLVSGLGIWALVVLAALLIVVTAFSWVMKKNCEGVDAEQAESVRRLAITLLISSLGVLPLIAIQEALPYVRVLCHLNVVGAVGLACAAVLVERYAVGSAKRFGVAAVLAILLAIAGSSFRYQSTGAFEFRNEATLEYIFNTALAGRETNDIVLGDEYIELHYYYNWGINGWEKTEPMVDEGGPDVVIVNNAQLEPGYKGKWPCYYGFDELPWDYINDEMGLIYRDDCYTVYII